MRDLYATEEMAGSPEEISTFINHFLHSNSSSSSAPKFSSSPFVAFSNPLLRTADAAASSSAGYRLEMPETHRTDVMNYPESGSFMWKEKRVSSDNEDVEKASEIPADAARHRSSSKRSRTAEIHNMSEKRRRSRINEKMKALQNLIPNSNKTDKASMLDEAIEYLKQLQLQVQMLTMRNGLSLHPMCVAGGVQPPMVGLSINEVGYAFNQEKPELLPMTRPPPCAISSDAIVAPASFGPEPLYSSHYGGPFASSVKELNSHGHHQTDTD